MAAGTWLVLAASGSLPTVAPVSVSVRLTFMPLTSVRGTGLSATVSAASVAGVAPTAASVSSTASVRADPRERVVLKGARLEVLPFGRMPDPAPLPLPWPLPVLVLLLVPGLTGFSDFVGLSGVSGFVGLSPGRCGSGWSDKSRANKVPESFT